MRKLHWPERLLSDPTRRCSGVMMVARLVMACVLAIGAVSSHGQESRIAFVDIERILQDAPQAVAATRRLEQEFSPKDRDLKEQRRRFRDLEDKLVSDGRDMKRETRSEMESELREISRKIRLLQEEIDQELRVRRSQELSKFQSRIREVISEIARAERFDLVLTAGVVYASKEADITAKVLQALREAFERSGN